MRRRRLLGSVVMVDIDETSVFFRGDFDAFGPVRVGAALS